MELFLFLREPENVEFMEERDLIRMIRGNDADAFRILLKEYLPLISRTAYRIMCDRTDSEYVTRTVMISLWQYPLSFREGTDISQEILRRECRLCRRRLLRRRLLMLLAFDPDLFIASSPSVPSSDEYIARQAWQVFCRASRNFTDNQRIAYTLCELEGLSEKDAAYIGGFHLQTVGEAVASATAFVKEELDHYGRMSDYNAYVGFLRKVEDLLYDNLNLQEQIMEYIYGKDR